MPKIEVYKGNRVMIPVAEAKKANAYICPWTQQLFSTKKSYISHLKKLREERMHRAAKRNLHRKLGENLWSQPTFDDIINWIHLHPDYFFTNAAGHTISSYKDKVESVRKDFAIKIIGLNLRWSNNLSCTHSCPHTGVRNWDGKAVLADGSPAPRGYPGWGGSISFTATHSLGFGSDVFSGSRIHTGSGGGGINNSRYEVKFYDDDWPGLTNQMQILHDAHDKEGTFLTVSGKYQKPFSAEFNYGKKSW